MREFGTLITKELLSLKSFPSGIREAITRGDRNIVRARGDGGIKETSPRNTAQPPQKKHRDCVIVLTVTIKHPIFT